MKRLFVPVILFLLFFSSHSAIPQTTMPDGAVLVTNVMSSSVSVIFTDQEKEPITIRTDEGPSEIVISPDRRVAVVSHYGHAEPGNSLSLIDLKTFTLLRRLEFGQHVRPFGLAFIPETKKLLVTNEVRNSVWVIDLETDKVIAEILTNQAKPRLIAVHPSGKTAYVTNETAGTVSVIDLEKFCMIRTIHISEGIEAIDISPDGAEVWAANKLDQKIHVIETAIDSVVQSFESPVYPIRLKFTPDGNNVIALNLRSGHITIIHADTKQDRWYLSPDDYSDVLVLGNSAEFEKRLDDVRKSRIPVPVGLGVSPNRDVMFVASQVKNGVSIMNLAGDQKWKSAGQFHLDNTPASVAFLPSRVDVFEYTMKNSFDDYWDENRPVSVYIDSLARSTDEEFERDFETPFKFLMEFEELDEYELMTDIAVRKKFITDYINNRDENPLNPVNYWFLEYIGRVTYSQEHYSRIKPPYIDDRGKFHIKYGPPFRKHVDPGGTRRGEFLTKFRNRFGTGKIGGSRMQTKFALASIPDSWYVTFPNESWLYITGKGRSFTVHFAENPYFRELKLGLAEAVMDAKPFDKPWYWMDLVRERFFVSSEFTQAIERIEKWQDAVEAFYFQYTPNPVAREYTTDTFINPNNPAEQMQIYSYDVAAGERTRKNRADINVDLRYDKVNLIGFQLDTAQFKGNNSRTKLILSAYTDPHEIRPFDPDNAGTSLNLDIHYMLRDSALNEFFRDESTGSFNDFSGMDAVLLSTQSSLSPFSGDLTIQLNNTDTGETGFRKIDYEVRDFSGDGLMLSDILYYASSDDAGFNHKYPVRLIEDNEVIQYPYPFITHDMPLLCYFEAYNLLISTGGSIYNIEMKLTRDRSDDNALKKVGRLFRRGEEEVRSISYQLTDYENDWKELIGFDLTDVDKGKYILEISITSAVNENITASTIKKLELR